MSTIYFDTLKFARKMETAGFTVEQSRIAAEAFGEALGESLVTQSMLKETQHALEAKMDANKIENYKFNIGQTIVLAGLMITILKLFK